MSTVIRYRGLSFIVRTKDHGNPHCHVTGQGGEAKIYLDTFDVERVKGYSQKDMRLILEVVKDQNDALKAKWKEYHEKET